jgi:hypothetical protein
MAYKEFIDFLYNVRKYSVGDLAKVAKIPLARLSSSGDLTLGKLTARDLQKLDQLKSLMFL